MILENGVIRTLDPSLPESRALAIAGDRIAGGVGVHETALASPETVDLRRPVRAAWLHRLARPFPDVGGRSTRGQARRLRVARRGAGAHPGRTHDRRLAAR